MLYLYSQWFTTKRTPEVSLSHLLLFSNIICDMMPLACQMKNCPHNNAQTPSIVFLLVVFLSVLVRLKAIVRIRSCLYGPSVNNSRVNCAHRLWFLLCPSDAELSYDHTHGQPGHLTHPLSTEYNL